MAQVTSDFLTGVFTEFSAIFKQNFDQVTTFYDQVATVIPSSTTQNTYEWLGALPQPREWLGERQVKELFEHNYTVVNRTWEDTIAVDRNTFEDDRLDQIKPRIAYLGAAMKRFFDIHTFTDVLDSGFTKTCYDGQNYFSASHSEGNSGTQSNTSSLTLSQTNLQTAINGMRMILNDQGHVMGINPDTLVVGPNLEFRAAELLQSPVQVTRVGDGTAGSGATAASNYLNVLNGRLKLIVSPFVSGYHWFVLDTSMPIKPLIFQLRKDPEFNALQDPNSSDTVFNTRMFKYGIYARFEVAYGLWQQAYGSNASS